MAIKDAQKETVLQQIRHIGDIPAMAETIRHFEDLKSSEDQNITEIANIILKDYALTTKLLKVVNSVVFLSFGLVTTISRAIFLLGIGQIREIALTLMILDHFEKKGSQNLGLETINQAFFSGFLARNLVRDLRFIEEEEGFICTMLHPLGKILTAFALPESFLEIRQKSQETGMPENVIAREVLGISFEEIGTTIATEWNFPSAIIQSMRQIRPRDIVGNPGEKEKLRLLATLATEITTSLVGDSDFEEKLAVVGRILKGYELQIPVMGKIEDLISATARDWKKLAEDLNLNASPSTFSRQMINW
ncbi:MAG TPA: HDOD domain-containing protein, partial [Thermodesulfobacteriota bacterium]|nr:HDOD domain-containing protein [Thermodesulfobacteriota bacterium]